MSANPGEKLMDRSAVIVPDAQQVCGPEAGVRSELVQSALTALLFFFLFFFVYYVSCFGCNR